MQSSVGCRKLSAPRGQCTMFGGRKWTKTMLYCQDHSQGLSVYGSPGKWYCCCQVYCSTVFSSLRLRELESALQSTQNERKSACLISNWRHHQYVRRPLGGNEWPVSHVPPRRTYRYDERQSLTRPRFRGPHDIPATQCMRKCSTLHCCQ